MSDWASIFGRAAGSAGPRWISPTATETARQLTRRAVSITAGLSPPAAPQASPAMKVITLDLSVVRADVPFEVSGTVVWYQSSTNPSDVVTVRHTDITNDLIPFRPGQAIGGRGFLRLLISNAAIAGATATLIVMTETGDGERPIQVR